MTCKHGLTEFTLLKKGFADERSRKEVAAKRKLQSWLHSK